MENSNWQLLIDNYVPNKIFSLLCTEFSGSCLHFLILFYEASTLRLHKLKTVINKFPTANIEPKQENEGTDEMDMGDMDKLEQDPGNIGEVRCFKKLS